MCGLFRGVNYCMCYVLEDVRGSRRGSRVLIIGVMAAGVALGIGFGAVLNLHFLRKRRFVSVVLSDPSTRIQYWRFGRAVMTFPLVFHWWFSGLWIATVSPVCNGGDCGCVYFTFLLFCCFGVRGVHRGVEQLLPIRGVACSRLAVKGWNHGVGGEVRVALVIGQYLGLGCFGIVEWPGQHCRCPRNLVGGCVSIHYPLCGFHWEFCPAIGLVMSWVWGSMEVISRHQYRLPCWNILYFVAYIQSQHCDLTLNFKHDR